MTTTYTPKQAETIVSEFGKLLAEVSPSIYGLPISRLPYNKEHIKTAIQTLIINTDKADKKIQEGLTQAYVFLAQFIEDDKITTAENGRLILEQEVSEKTVNELELANQAVQIINSIKNDMENLMGEIRLLLPR